MGSNEALVPKGMEHGKRKELEEQMELGGVPKNPISPTGGGVPPYPSPSAATGGGTSRPANLEGWDVLQDREPPAQVPGVPPSDPMGLFQARVEASPNSALQYYFGRTAEFLE